MCVVSMIGDDFSKDWTRRFPDFIPTAPTVPFDPEKHKLVPPSVSRAEFDELKREVELLKRLLKAAKEYDARNNEPNCDQDEKTKLLKAIAEKVGVDLSEIFPD